MRESSSLIFKESLRGDDSHGLAVPSDLAAQPVAVLVQDPVGRNRALVPVLNRPQYSPDLFVIDPRPRYLTRKSDRVKRGTRRSTISHPGGIGRQMSKNFEQDSYQMIRKVARLL